MNLSPSVLTRRRFLANSTKAASTLSIANLLVTSRSARGQPRKLSANDKLNIAFVGVTGRGGNNLAEITEAEDVNVFALCDVDEKNLDSVGTKYPSAKRYRDYRKLLETEK